MEVRISLKVLLYLILLFCAFGFVKQTIEEFLSDNTAYSMSQEPISLRDLPTMTICWRVDPKSIFGFPRQIYGKDFTTDIRFLEEKTEKTTTLVENQSVPTHFGIYVYISEFLISNYSRYCYPLRWKDRQCFKVSSKWTGNHQLVDFKKFRVQLAFKFSRPTGFKTEVMLTSEANSYGKVWDRWFHTWSPVHFWGI